MATDGCLTLNVPGSGDNIGNDLPEVSENALWMKILFTIQGIPIPSPGQTTAQSQDIVNPDNSAQLSSTQMSSPAGGTVYATGTYAYNSSGVLQTVTWTFTDWPGFGLVVAYQSGNICKITISGA